MVLFSRAASRGTFVMVMVAGTAGAIVYGVVSNRADGETLEEESSDEHRRVVSSREEKIERLREIVSAEQGGEPVHDGGLESIRRSVESYAEQGDGSPRIEELRCSGAGLCLLVLDHGTTRRAVANNAAVISRKLVDWEGPMVSHTVSRTVQELFLIEKGLIFDGWNLVPSEEVRERLEGGGASESMSIHGEAR
jgi:hypothetical protein